MVDEGHDSNRIGLPRLLTGEFTTLLQAWISGSLRISGSGRYSQSPIRSKFLPLANVPLEAHALGNFESRDQAPLDLLAALSGVIAI